MGSSSAAVVSDTVFLNETCTGTATTSWDVGVNVTRGCILAVTMQRDTSLQCACRGAEAAGLSLSSGEPGKNNRRNS